LYYQHILEEDQQAVTQQFEKFLSENTDYVLQYRILTKDGVVKVLESQGKILPATDGNTKKVIGTTRDVTKIAKYEKNLEAIIKDLNRSNKELEEFAYIASHDLQEPLRKLSTFSERLVTKYTAAFDQEGKLYIQRILAAAENMRILIDNLLEFSRTTRPSMPFEKTDLSVILSNAISTLEVSIENTNAAINIEQPLPIVEAVPTQMEQLFINLVGNAVKFHKPGAKVVIDITAEKLSPAETEKLNLDTEKKYYKIELRDNGIGFEQEYAERIFQIFQRLHGKVEYPGSGIGLAICKKIVENHGGVIYADGVPDNGTVFTVVLPETQQ
jgi:light-regulated signal transduction histidine kinase (bacteriophytochrome)